MSASSDRCAGLYLDLLKDCLIRDLGADVRALEHLRECVADVFLANVDGDLVTTAGARGEAAVFMRAVLESSGPQGPHVWVAGPIAGPDQVRDNFRRYNLLDDRVHFFPGTPGEGLSHLPVPHISILRIEANPSDATLPVLKSLYERVSLGGYVILHARRDAAAEFRAKQSITEPLLDFGTAGVYWRRMK